MDKLNDIVERYVAVWNETDAAQRRDLIAQTWTEDATYLDPLMQGEGHAGIDALVRGVQAQFAGYRFRRIGVVDGYGTYLRFAGYRFRRIGVVDGYGTYLRFAWELGPHDGPAPIAGSDIAIFATDGRLQRVIGFLDRVPPGAVEA